MAYPISLTPVEIEQMTLRQIALYFEEDGQAAYEDVIAELNEYRRKHGIPGPDDRR